VIQLGGKNKNRIQLSLYWLLYVGGSSG